MITILKCYLIRKKSYDTLSKGAIFLANPAYSNTEFMNISFAKSGAVQPMWRLLALILGEERGGEQVIKSQNTYHK